jgi:hypothetical protein
MVESYLFAIDTQWEPTAIVICCGGGDRLEPSLQGCFPQSSPQAILRRES